MLAKSAPEVAGNPSPPQEPTSLGFLPRRARELFSATESFLIRFPSAGGDNQILFLNGGV